MEVQLRQKTVSNVEIILDLYILDQFGTRYQRTYYKGLVDQKTIIVYTTDELDDHFESRNYGEEFEGIPDFERFFKSFEEEFHTNWPLKQFKNWLPNYLKYRIEFIHDDFKPVFIKQFADAVEGYSDSDYTPYEKECIEYWKEKIWSGI